MAFHSLKRLAVGIPMVSEFILNLQTSHPLIHFSAQWSRSDLDIELLLGRRIDINYGLLSLPLSIESASLLTRQGAQFSGSHISDDRSSPPVGTTCYNISTRLQWVTGCKDPHARSLLTTTICLIKFSIYCAGNLWVFSTLFLAFTLCSVRSGLLFLTFQLKSYTSR
jgi:hypothetical protein